MISHKTISHFLFPCSLFSIANVTSCIIQQWHILFLPQIPLVANIPWGHLLSSLSQNYRILEMQSWQSFLTEGLLTFLECLLWASHFIYFILLNPHLTLTCEFHCSCILDEKTKNKNKNWGLGRQSNLPKVTFLVTQIHDNLKACFSKWALYTAQSHKKSLKCSTFSEVLILSNPK